MKVTRIEPFPPGNPFEYDWYLMGTSLGSNVVAMYEHHVGEYQARVILVDTTTGERIQVDFAPRRGEDGR